MSETSLDPTPEIRARIESALNRFGTVSFVVSAPIIGVRIEGQRTLAQTYEVGGDHTPDLGWECIAKTAERYAEQNKVVT